MSRTLKLVSVAIAIVLTATIVGIVAYDRGKAAPRARYDLRVGTASPVVRGAVLKTQGAQYRLNLAPGTVISVDPRPGCRRLTWQAIRIRSDAR